MTYGTLNVNRVAGSGGGSISPDSSVFRNRIINGAMVIDQRNAGAGVTPTAWVYTLDRWLLEISQASRLTIQRNAGSVTPPAGFTNYLGATVASAATVGSGDYFELTQHIEGFNIADFGWGTANAQTITVSFWVRSSITGTHSGVVMNDGENRSYPFTFVINSANTWEQKSVTIAGDTTGTWLTNNGSGIKLRFSLGGGSSFRGTAGAWTNTDCRAGATGAVNVVATNGATFYITGVQLEVGTQATSFEYRPYGTELALCQRYYFKLSGARFSGFGSGYYRSATTAWALIRYPVTMRAAPTATQANTQIDDANLNIAVTGIGTSYYNADSVMLGLTVASGGTQYRPITWGSDNATTGYADFSAEL